MKKKLAAVGLLTVLVGAYNNCAQRPMVEIGDYASVGYQHTGVEKSCAMCHESTRPLNAGVDPILHGNKADCVACHAVDKTIGATPDQKSAIWAGKARSYSHTASITSCTDCHSPNRPAPIAGVTHYDLQDCVMCHASGTSNNTDGLTQTQIAALFRTAYAYTHSASLNRCAGCHEKNRYAPSHNPGVDCVGCHTPSNAWNRTLTSAQINALWLSGVK